MIKKILFWLFVLGIGFVNPLFSVGLIILYYLPRIMSDLINNPEPENSESRMKSFSDDVLEEMK